MLQSGQLRDAIDAHAVGRRQTGNETYAVELTSALARRDDVDPSPMSMRGPLGRGPTLPA